MASVTIGRPKKQIDWALFEEACNVQCTQQEICAFLRINHETLTKHVLEHYGEPYSQVYNRFIEGGKMSLRRMQYKLAKTNTGMCIWLGKQYLNQRDNIAMTHASPEVVKCFEDVMKQIAGKQKEMLDIADAKIEAVS